MKIVLLKIFLFLTITGLLTSCEKQNAPRTFNEYTSESFEQSLPTMQISRDQDDPHAGFNKAQLAKMLLENNPESASQNLMTWSVPKNWEERPAQGMRIATFVDKSSPESIDCSIVTLGAGAGGLSANIIRWLEQIKVPIPPESELNAFITNAEKIQINDNLSASIFNFSTLQKKDSITSPSMIAAIIEIPDQRIFIKMTGNKQDISNQYKNFKALIQSLKLKK
ncbi:MAG: hypothetical protein H6754_04435 [Candidatus Omnitrophica bacterium]|nr:hypothetical protein [Candidatus Omnitrophota bacterium]